VDGLREIMNEAWLTVFAAIFGGALRVSTPFLFVSLGECITEKSGRVNLGLEGTLVFGAMGGYAVSYHSGSAAPACCSVWCTAGSAHCRA
jgi:simple sugar transport system permease protein